MISRAVGMRSFSHSDFPTGSPCAGEECVCHAAADNQRVDFREQMTEQVEFGRNLGAADDRGDRALRRVERLRERFKLGRHGAAGIGGKAGDRDDPDIGGVGAVRDRKCLVDEDVAERGELLRERRVVLFLFRMEAGVFQTENVAVAHGGDGCFCLRADAVVGEGNRLLKMARDFGGSRAQRVFGVAALWPAEMRQQDHLAALAGDLEHGRRDFLDAGGVGDLAVLHRHVEIDAHEHAPALHVGVVEAAKRHGRKAQPSAGLPATAVSSMRLEKPHSLSYHDITRTSVPSITLVWSMWKIDERGS